MHCNVPCVLLLCAVAVVQPFGLFLDFVRACTVIKPELSPSHLTTEEHEVEKCKEEEQIRLLLEADGWAAPAKYVNKYLQYNVYVFISLFMD